MFITAILILECTVLFSHPEPVATTHWHFWKEQTKIKMAKFESESSFKIANFAILLLVIIQGVLMNFCLLFICQNLQSSESNRGHPTKFLTTFWHLFDNFLMASHCIWPMKLQGLWEVELSIVGKPTWHLKMPPLNLSVLTFWLARLKGSHQKVDNLKMSQSCQKLIKTLAMVRCPWE